MNDIQKHKLAMQTADYMDTITEAITDTHAIQALTFKELTPEIWAAIQENQDVHREIFDTMFQSLMVASKTIDNDAFQDHMAAVLSAP